MEPCPTFSLFCHTLCGWWGGPGFSLGEPSVKVARIARAPPWGHLQLMLQATVLATSFEEVAKGAEECDYFELWCYQNGVCVLNERWIGRYYVIFN